MVGDNLNVHKILLKKQNKKIDGKIFFSVLFLTVVGLIAVADASAPQALNDFNDKYYFLKQQAVWWVLGITVMLVVSQIKYTLWEKLSLPFLIISFLALIAVLIPGVGTKVLGARRWIFIGSASIQPSELIKISLLIYLAALSSANKGILAYLLPVGLAAGLIMLEPDLGTTIILTAMSLVQIFASGIKLKDVILSVVAGLGAGLFFSLTSEYRRDRLLTFFKASQDPLGRDYHIRQVLLGLGSGGLFGVGLGQSHQKYLFLPEASTDSIFAVIAEEVGFLGSFMIIGVFVFLILRGFKIANSAPDQFSRVLAVGITAWLGVQTLLNIGAMTAIVPLTGIPLPFISYGGSALVTILFATGILLNISKYANEK
jgi:cell division protein FtsW